MPKEIPVATPVNDYPYTQSGTTYVEEEYGEVYPNPNSNDNNNNNNNNSNPTDKLIGAAAIAGGITGLALSGPIIGLVSAVGTATLAATTPPSHPVGNIARASGDVVLSASEKAQELNQKHHIVEKTKVATKGMIHRVKEMDEKHGLCEKTKQGVVKIVNKTKEMEEKHHFGEKAGKTVTRGLQLVSDSLRPKK